MYSRCCRSIIIFLYNNIKRIDLDVFTTVNMHIHAHKYMCTPHMHTYIHIHTHMHIHTHVHIYLSINTYTYIRTCKYIVHKANAYKRGAQCPRTSVSD